MSEPTSFDAAVASTASDSIVNVSPFQSSRLSDVSVAAYEALLSPSDFPGIVDAVVPGDHVVLAIDPNVPRVVDVLRGVMRALSETEAGRVDVVLWDEATEPMIESLAAEIGPTGKILRHQGASRKDVRYLAADDGGYPVYLNRLLVDADLVIPIAVCHLGFGDAHFDATGIYPMLVDSASRRRALQNERSGAPDSVDGKDPPASWLLGVQMMIVGVPNSVGDLNSLLCGTAFTIDRHLKSLMPDKEPPTSDLVLVGVTGHQNQTWANAARAAMAASIHANPDATIVLWTSIDHGIDPVMARSESDEDLESDADDEDEGDEGNFDEVTGLSMADDEDFPALDLMQGPRECLGQIATDYRLLIRSGLDADVVENTGFGVIESAQQWARLSGSFDECLVLGGAQFLTPLIARNDSV